MHTAMNSLRTRGDLPVNPSYLHGWIPSLDSLDDRPSLGAEFMLKLVFS